MTSFAPAALLDLNQLSGSLSLDSLYALLTAFDGEGVQLSIRTATGELHDSAGRCSVSVEPEGIRLALHDGTPGDGRALLIRHGVTIPGDPVLTYFA